MKLGVFSYNTEYGIRPDTLARALEERGFESLWVGEHTHIPAERKTPYPGGGDLPRPYYHMADPFVSLMAAASATKDLRIGTAVSLIPQHDPIVLAKTIGTLDYLSGGRFILGIGGGWNAEECEDHGVAFKDRWKVLRERVQAMKELWTNEEASFHGEFVNFDRAISFPKPVQSPHPRILFGGATENGRKRVVEYCDGWFPIDILLDDLPPAIADLKEKAKAAGRDPESIEVDIFAFDVRDPDILKRYRDMGIERVVIYSPRAEEKVMPWLDNLAPQIAAVA
ncbi:MAG: LLM class F420-dependent oxidoreductase [Alphaproteobacteria bacterium]